MKENKQGNRSFQNKYLKTSSMLILSLLLALLFSISVLAAPSTPTGIKQTKAAESSITISWNNVMGTNISYEVEYSQNNRDWYSAGYTTSSNSIYKGGLTAGTTYYFRVRAYERVYPDKIYGAWSAGIAATTAPAIVDSKSIVQSGASDKSASISWNKVLGATGYRIYRMESSQEIYVGSSGTNSYTVQNLNAGVSYQFKVYAERSVNGFTTQSSYGARIYDVKTAPKSITGIKTTNGYPSIKQVEVEWNKDASASGYELMVYSMKNKKIGSTKIVKYSTGRYNLSGISPNSFYKVKIRGYVQLKSGKIYGPWSTGYIANQPKIAAKQSGSGIKVSWNKVTGANNYTVSISTKLSSGYKKVATTSSTKRTITKYGSSKLKKRKTYYIKVVSNKKVGGKTYKGSDTYVQRVTFR